MGTADAVSSVGVLDSGVTVLIIRAVDLLAIDRSVNEDEERIRNVLWRSCGETPQGFLYTGNTIIVTRSLIVTK